MLFVRKKPCLGSIGKVSKSWTYCNQMVPELSDGMKASSGRSVISTPYLFQVCSLTEMIDEGDGGHVIHQHCQQVALGCSFLWEECWTVREQLSCIPVDVNKYCVIFSGGSRGVSEVSTETPFCCNCIIAHISRTRAADLLSRSSRESALALARYKYLQTPSAYIRSDYRSSRDLHLSTLHLHVNFSTPYFITETGQGRLRVYARADVIPQSRACI